MTLFFGTRRINRDHLFPLLLFIFTGLFFNACATATHFPPEIAKDVRLTPTQAVAVIKKEARASGTDADYGSFGLDTRGFSFTKTVKKTRKRKASGITGNVEYQEIQVHRAPWQSVFRIDPYLKETFIGDLYGVELKFISIKTVSGLQEEISTNLDLFCDDYEEMTRIVAALQTLIDDQVHQ